MRVLALDLSLTATGWATTLNDHGVYGTHAKGVERLNVLDGWLSGLVDASRPQVAVVEGYAYGKGNQAHQVGEWGGVARLRLYSDGVPFVVVPPAVVKKYATGRGNAPKPDLRMELYKRAGLDVADDNEVDALWLLAAALEVAGDPLWPMPKANVDALAKVEWPSLSVLDGKLR